MTGVPSGRAHVPVALVSAAALLVLTGLVAAGVTHGLDEHARQLFRPDDRWGDLQRRVDLVVEGLQPPVTLALLLAVGAVTARARGCWSPLVTASGLVLAAAVTTQLLQWAVARPDTHGVVAPLGGSYPSGHTVALVVCAGGIVLLVRPGDGRALGVWCAAAGLVMGIPLLLQAAHWLTDVLGGLLLATTLVAVAAHLLALRGGDTQLWWSGTRRDAGRRGAVPEWSRQTRPGGRVRGRGRD